MLHELIAYVILPDSLRYLQQSGTQQGGLVERQVRTDFLNQKVLMLNCADHYRVRPLEAYLEARILAAVAAKNGLIKPTTLRKYVDYSLANLHLLKIDSPLELGLALRGLPDIIRQHPIVAMVVCAGVEYLDLNGFVATDVKGKGNTSSVKKKEPKKDSSGMHGVSAFTKASEFSKDILQKCMDYVCKEVQPVFHFSLVLCKMERLLFKGKLFRDVIYSSFQRLDVEKGKDYAGEYLEQLPADTVLVVNMSERDNEQRNISIIRRNVEARVPHEFYAVNFTINEDLEGTVVPDYEAVEQVRFTYVSSS